MTYLNCKSVRLVTFITLLGNKKRMYCERTGNFKMPSSGEEDKISADNPAEVGIPGTVHRHQGVGRSVHRAPHSGKKV